MNINSACTWSNVVQANPFSFNTIAFIYSNNGRKYFASKIRILVSQRRKKKKKKTTLW
jgi:hypothetical protein